MPKKNTIESLMTKLENETKHIESLNTNLEDTLKCYEKTILLSKQLLKQVNQHKTSFELLKKQSDSLFKTP